MATYYTGLTGSLSSIPAPYTMEFLRWSRRIIDYRLSYSVDPATGTSRARGTTFYITLSGTAGSGSGTLGSPRQCPTTADVQTYIAANIGSGNVAFLLKRGTTALATTAKKTGVTISNGTFTLGPYAESGTTDDLAPPELSGFKAAYGSSGWTTLTAGGGTVYSRTDTDAVLDVRSGSSGDFEAYLKNPYIRYATGADVAAKIVSLQTLAAAGRRGWFYDAGTTTLYISTGNTGTTERDLAQGCIGWGNGIAIQDFDDVLIEGINVTGFGNANVNGTVVESGGSLMQNYLIQSQAKGTNQHTIYRCGGYNGFLHAMGHYVGAAALANVGGIVLWHSNRFGLARHSSSGSTQGVSYNGDGGHEAYWANNYVTHGATQTEAYNSYSGEAGYGHPIFGHGPGSGPKLVLVSGTLYGDHPINKLGGCTCFEDLVIPATRRTWADYRGFVIGERCVGRVPVAVGNFHPFGYGYHRINSVYRIQPHSTFTQQSFGYSTSIYGRGSCFNVIIDVDARTTSGAVSLYKYDGGADIADYDFVNGAIIMAGASGQVTKIDGKDAVGGTATTSNLINSVVANTGSGLLYLGGPPNADARGNAQGGHAGTLMSKVKKADTGGFAAGWSTAGTAGAARDATPLWPLETEGPSPAYAALATAYPKDLVLEYDLYGQPRGPIPTIGPVAGQGPAYSTQRPRLRRNRTETR